jgi:hypothetical protein
LERSATRGTLSAWPSPFGLLVPLALLPWRTTYLLVLRDVLAF